MKKIASITSLLVFFVELLFLSLWFACNELKGLFYFSMTDVQLILVDQIHNDKHTPIYIVRLFHNKIITTSIEFFRHYIFFWDIRYLTPLLSPIGVFSLVAGFWYLIQSKIRVAYKLLIFIIVLTSPLFEMVFKPHIAFPLRISAVTLPALILSFYGMWCFMQKRSVMRYIIVLILLLLSLWWFFIFRMEVFNFCVKA